jgi:hypothetical protein
VKHAAGLFLIAALLAASPSAQALDRANLAHIVVIVFENKEERQVIGSSAAPTFTAMARTYVQLTRYTAITHPSLPNYLALVSGSTHGIRSNCTACVVSAPSLADTIEHAGRSWRTYAEGLPRAGYTAHGQGGTPRSTSRSSTSVTSSRARRGGRRSCRCTAGGGSRERFAAGLRPRRPRPVPFDARLPGPDRRPVAPNDPVAAAPAAGHGRLPLGLGEADRRHLAVERDFAARLE